MSTTRTTTNHKPQTKPRKCIETMVPASLSHQSPLLAAFMPPSRHAEISPPFLAKQWQERRAKDLNTRYNSRANLALHQSSSNDEHIDMLHDDMPLRIYKGPILPDPNEIVAGFALGELGLDLAVAPSTIAPGTLGLFVALSEGVESTTVPSMELLCGYSREGTFRSKDEGDKTVGFALAGPETAVFYDRKLMSVLDALKLAAETKGEGGACGLAGHVLVQDENGEVDVSVDTGNADFKRYYVPALMNKESDGENDDEEDDNNCDNEVEISVQNLGQFCNDLAWSYDDPPESKEEYDSLSLEKNAVQLVWRLEFDPESNCLCPTWPVSVVAEDIVFKNAEAFMELGTKYGWNYWQATVDMESLS